MIKAYSLLRLEIINERQQVAKTYPSQVVHPDRSTLSILPLFGSNPRRNNSTASRAGYYVANKAADPLDKRSPRHPYQHRFDPHSSEFFFRNMSDSSARDVNLIRLHSGKELFVEVSKPSSGDGPAIVCEFAKIFFTREIDGCSSIGNLRCPPQSCTASEVTQLSGKQRSPTQSSKNDSPSSATISTVTAVLHSPGRISRSSISLKTSRT